MTPAQPQQFDPVADWKQQFGSQIPPDTPDTAYDALRDQYFQSRVMPHVLKGGYDPTESWDKFKAATEREHSSGPGLAATAAVDSFLAPFKDIAPYTAEKVHISREEKALEVKRAGGAAPAWEMAGELAGQAPFWMSGMEGAGAVGKAFEFGPLLTRAMRVAAGGMIQGSYDAAKAPAGRGIIEGLQGAAWGAGLTGAFESAGPLWRALMDGGMEENAAKHIEGVTQGTQPVNDQTVETVLKTPKLDVQINDWMGQQLQALKRSGVPVEIRPGMENERINIQMIGADGKPYDLGGPNGAMLSDINNIIQRIGEHLDAGGSIDRIRTDGKTVAQFYNILAGNKPDAFDLLASLRSDIPNSMQFKMPNDEILPDRTEEREHELYGYRGAAVEATNLGMAQDDYMSMMRASGMKFIDTPGIGRNMTMKAAVYVHELINARNSVYHATDLEGMKGILEAGKIEPSAGADELSEEESEWQASAIAQIQHLYGGSVAESLDFLEEIKNDPAKLAAHDIPPTTAGVSVSRTPRLASKADKAITFVIDAEKMPATRSYVESGYGKTKEPAGTFGEYAQGPPPDEAGYQEWLENRIAEGTVTPERNPQFEFEQRTFNEPIPLNAVRGIIVDKSALTEPLTGTEPSWVPKERMANVQLLTSVAQNLADQYKIPIRFVENGQELHGYRAGISKLPESQRFQIPLYDQLQELPSGQVLNKITGEVFDSVNDVLYGKSIQAHDMSPEFVRGDGVKLNDTGKAEVDTLGRQFARKGGLDQIIVTSNARSIETAQAILKHDPNLQIKDVTRDMSSWGNGDLIGTENTKDVRAYKDSLAKDQPDLPISGRDPDSGRSGESFNQVKNRILPYIKQVMDEWSAKPPEARGKVGIVTHFTPIKVTEGWLAAGMPDDLSIDMPTYLRERASPGGVYRLAPSRASMSLPEQGSQKLWYSPKGKEYNLGRDEPGEDNPMHADFFFGKKMDQEEASAKGWIRVSGDSVSGNLEPSLGLDKAIQKASKLSDDGNVFFSPTVDLSDHIVIPKDNISEFLDNPRAYFNRYKNIKFGLPGMEQQDWTLRKVNMANDQPLEDGIYLIRHGETSMNKGGMPTTGAESGEEPTLAQYQGKYKETPIAHRFVGEDIPGLSPEVIQKYPDEPIGMTLGNTGQKSSIFYRNPNRETMFHETFHALMNSLGLADWFDNLKSDHPYVRDVYNNWFSDEAKSLYRDRYTAEEVMAYAMSALRTGRYARLDEIARADTDLATTFQFISDTAKELYDEALAKNRDSIPLRTFMRKMGSVMNRSTEHLEDLQNYYSSINVKPDIERGFYTLKDGDTKTFYSDRESLVSDMEQEWQEPLQAPNLVDGVPANTPKYAARLPAPNPNRPPVGTEPPPPDLASKRPPIRAGSYLFSRLFRPFYDWLGDWTSKFDRQDIYNSFDKIRESRVDYNNAMRPFTGVLTDLIDKYKPERWTDWFKYIQAEDAEKPFVARELNFKPEELADVKTWQDQFHDPLGEDLVGFIQKDIPRLESAGWDIEKVFPRGKDDSFFGQLVQSERLDPKDTNLMRMSATVLRSKMFDTFMDPTLEDAEKLIKDSKAELGSLYPLLRRHLAAIRGIPDYTQQIAHGVIDTATEMINSGIERFNEMLPGSIQVPKIETPPQEILQDYLTFSYAGMLGMRPGIWVRDASQFFVTSFPLLGNYSWKGMSKAMETIKKGASSEAFTEAQKYGVFIEKNEINQMVTAGGGSEAGEGALGKLEKWSQAAMGAQRWAHNSNRLVSFWGHAQKVMDATEQFGRDGDLEDWIKNSDAWFMNQGMRNRYVKEVQNITQEGYDNFSKRMAKSLTELTQWNYNREASPGIYDYAIGRLFGQYGTWPLNYIEYARRFAMGADKAAAAQALARLVIAHGSILAAGHAAGIDTSDWVFTQPMAYGGGPIMDAVTSIPEAAGDWTSPRGAEARRNVLEVVSPLNMIPGIEELRAIHEAVTSKDPNLYVRMLGFQPLEETSKHHGWHQVSP